MVREGDAVLPRGGAVSIDVASWLGQAMGVTEKYKIDEFKTLFFNHQLGTGTQEIHWGTDRYDGEVEIPYTRMLEDGRTTMSGILRIKSTGEVWDSSPLGMHREQDLPSELARLFVVGAFNDEAKGVVTNSGVDTLLLGAANALRGCWTEGSNVRCKGGELKDEKAAIDACVGDRFVRHDTDLNEELPWREKGLHAPCYRPPVLQEGSVPPAGAAPAPVSTGASESGQYYHRPAVFPHRGGPTISIPK